MVIIQKRTWLIRKDQKKVKNVCFVVVRGALLLGIAARLLVTGTFLATVSASSVSVLLSAWTDYALLFVLLPFALCIFCFLIRAKRGFKKKTDFLDVTPRPQSVEEAGCREQPQLLSVNPTCHSYVS